MWDRRVELCQADRTGRVDFDSISDPKRSGSPRKPETIAVRVPGPSTQVICQENAQAQQPGTQVRIGKDVGTLRFETNAEKPEGTDIS